jgi:hypothetical protein
VASPASAREATFYGSFPANPTLQKERDQTMVGYAAGKPWSSPVQIDLRNDGHYSNITNTKQAAGELIYHWPRGHRQDVRINALLACKDVFKGRTGPDMAREAFIAAAKAARLKVRS